MYRRPPQIGYGPGHGSPQHQLVAPHPHRAMISRGGVPLFWRPQQAPPPFPACDRQLATRRQQQQLLHQLETQDLRCGDVGQVPVEVQLPHGPVYLCDWADLIAHFPNVRHRLSGGSRVLRVEEYIERSNRGVLTGDALHHVFRAFELRRVTGLSVDLFERAQDLLRSNSSGNSGGGQFFQAAFDLFVGVCQALDSEGGLGCSDDLLGQIDEFAVELKAELADIGPWNYHTLEALLASYSKVFQPSTPHHMGTLRTLWMGVDLDSKARLLTGLSRELAFRTQRSNAHAMFRALSDMDML